MLVLGLNFSLGIPFICCQNEAVVSELHEMVEANTRDSLINTIFMDSVTAIQEGSVRCSFEAKFGYLDINSRILSLQTCDPSLRVIIDTSRVVLYLSLVSIFLVLAFLSFIFLGVMKKASL